MAKKPLVIPAQDKQHFGVAQLGEAFQLSQPTIRKMIGNTPPVGKRGAALTWRLFDVAEMKDVRPPWVPPKPLAKNAPSMMVDEDGDEVFETDPDKMKPMERKTHFQAEDLKQAAQLKARKNQVEMRELIPALEVEQALAGAFKTVALTLDTLGDALERDGMIDTSDIGRLLEILDSSREQLAADLLHLSPEVEFLNKDMG